MMNEEQILKKLPCSSLLDLQQVQALSRSRLTELIKKFGLEESVEEDSDLEDLQAVLFAFATSFNEKNIHSFHRSYELLTVFPDLDLELVSCLLESTGGLFTKDVVDEIVEINSEIDGSGHDVVTIPISQLIGSFNDDRDMLHIDRNCTLLVSDDKDQQVVGVSMNDSYGLNILSNLVWGVHKLQVWFKFFGCEDECNKNAQELSVAEVQVYVTSVVFDYTHCLERVFDLFHYGWQYDSERETWTSMLEESMLHLLISVDDDLSALVSSWKSMIHAVDGMGPGSLSRGMSDDLENMLLMVQTDATDALTTHSANALGRLHQVLTQFAEMSAGAMGTMVQIPQVFLSCVENFILAKVKSAKTTHVTFLEGITKLVNTGKRYSRHLKCKDSSTAVKIKELDDFIALFESKLPAVDGFDKVTTEEQGSIDEFFTKLNLSDIKMLESLKPSQLDSLINSHIESDMSNSDCLCFLPCLSLQDIVNPKALSRAVASLAENTYNDAITLGTTGEVGIGGYTMTSENRTVTCAIISSLLNAGMAYVATKETAKLMGHLPMWRSTLSLQPTGTYHDYLQQLPRRLKKRIKDMKRIFRNKVKLKLTFRLNADMPLAISLLREHHGVECWVGQELEQVWHVMAATSPPQLLIFQLYYGDILVAADFAHPISGGKIVYVATRYSARGHSSTSGFGSSMSSGQPHIADNSDIQTLQPGFILALLECRWLQQQGCQIIDWGGYNSSPLMQYKLELAGDPKLRSDSLYEFQEAEYQGGKSCLGCLMSMTSSTSSRVLLDDVKLEHLLGHSVSL